MSVGVGHRSWSMRREDYEAMKMRNLAVVLGKTNRILTSDKRITVNMVNQSWVNSNVPKNKPAPAWSSYPNIFINYSKFSNLGAAKTLVQFLGMNYHELSHLMFTPRYFRSRYIDDSNFEAWNVLEDQRIESLFTAMYEPAGKFFTEAVIKFMVDEPATWESAFAWTYGRSYLPLEIRTEFELRYAHQEDVEQIKALIDEFKSIPASKYSNTNFVNPTRERVLKIIEEFRDLVWKRSQDNNGNITEESPQETPKCDSGEQDDGLIDETLEEAAIEEDKRRRQEEEETGEDQSNFWDEEDGEEGEGDESDSEGGSDGEDDPSDSSSDGDDGEDDGDDEGAESSGEEDGDASSGESPDSDGDEGADGVGGSGGVFTDDELFEYLEDVIDAVHEDETVEEEVGNIHEAMNDQSRLDFIDFGNVGYQPHPPDAEMLATLRRITTEFRRLWAEVEPGWKYGSNVGRINIDRALQDPDDYDEIFDEWEEGKEHESGLEAVINLDISGSMDGVEMVMASKALWIIKRALDEVGASVTVFGFHEHTLGLMSREEKEKVNEWRLWNELGPDTLPQHALILSRRLLQLTDLPNKLEIIITDGGFGVRNKDGTQTNETLENILDTTPGIKMYVGIGSGWHSNNTFKTRCDASVEMTNYEDLTKIVKETVTAILQQIIQR